MKGRTVKQGAAARWRVRDVLPRGAGQGLHRGFWPHGNSARFPQKLVFGPTLHAAPGSLSLSGFFVAVPSSVITLGSSRIVYTVGQFPVGDGLLEPLHVIELHLVCKQLGRIFSPIGFDFG